MLLDAPSNTNSYRKELETATLALKDTDNLLLTDMTTPIIQRMDCKSGIDKLLTKPSAPKDLMIEEADKFCNIRTYNLKLLTH